MMNLLPLKFRKISLIIKYIYINLYVCAYIDNNTVSKKLTLLSIQNVKKKYSYIKR